VVSFLHTAKVNEWRKI